MNDVEAAWESSDYAPLSPAARARLRATATPLQLGRGERVPRPHGGSQAGLVVAGRLRVLVAAGGRQLTARYAEAGSAFAVPDLAAGERGASVEAAAEAVEDSRVLVFAKAELDDLLRTDPTMSTSVVWGLREAHHASIALLAGNVLSPLRTRVARHLLDLAARDGGRVTVRVPVRDIANAVGSVREVVTRTLRDFRDEGLITRDGGALVLLDLSALHVVAQNTG